MATWAVFATANEQNDDEQHDHDERDDPEHLHPARRAGRGPLVCVRAGIGSGRRIDHERSL